MSRILFMIKTLLAIAIVFFFSPLSLAADKFPAPGGFQHTLAAYHEDGFGGVKPNAWLGDDGQSNNETATIERILVDQSRDRSQSDQGMGVGLEVAPLFGTYGVFRTSSDNENSTYVALGFILDEYIMDESERLDGISDSGLSYGFGVNKSSYKLEYMMYVDEGDYEVSAIGLGIVSEF